MKKIIMGVIMVLLAVSVTVGHAQVREGSFSVTPFIGGYIFEGNEDLKNAPVFGLRGGYNFTKSLGVEGFFNYVPSEIKSQAGNPDVRLYGFGVEGLYHFMPESRLVPFVALGLGGSRYSAPGDIKDRDRFTVDYGAGLKYFLTENLALRADVRHVILPLHDRYNELLYTVGLNFTFGGAKKAAPSIQTTRAAEPAAAPVVAAPPPPPPAQEPVPPPPPPPAPEPVPPPPPPPVVQKAAPQAASAVETAIVEKGRATLNVEFDFG
jgi:OmpA-OmpF porin, OOP family